jgi:hypothetical protein
MSTIPVVVALVCGVGSEGSAPAVPPSAMSAKTNEDVEYRMVRPLSNPCAVVAMTDIHI